MNPPKISVVMPVFNGARWLPESLASIRRQAVPGLELIVIDDGSTDGSAGLVGTLAPEAQCHRQENRGAAAARNAGLERATGEFIAFLDHDDLWPDGSLRERIEALSADHAAMFVLGRTRFLAEAAVEPWVSPNLGAGLFRRELFARVGRFDPQRRLIEDVDWFLRVRDAGIAYVTLAAETLHYRRGTGGVTHARSWREPEVLSTVRASLARRRQAGHVAGRPLLSGAGADPRAAGPVNRAAKRIDVRATIVRSIWPTRPQLSLLRAALWQGDEARAAWEEWQACENLAALDYSSWQLLPLVVHNLAAQGVTDDLLAECHGFRLYHWARNQQILHQAARWVEEAQARGMPVVVLKGAALAAGTYPDAGLRPMADIDLLVPVAHAAKFAEHLQATGWRPLDNYLAWQDVSLDVLASFNWQRGDEHLDLHWHVLHRSTQPGVTQLFWERTRPLTLPGATALQLGPEDQFLHVCSHGLQYAAQPPFRWLADAAWILRRAGSDFDWARVRKMAEQTGTAFALRHGLEYATQELRLPVPAELLASLRQRRPSWGERWEYRRTTEPTAGNRWIRALNLARLLWRVGGTGAPWTRATRMRRFLCARWESPNLRTALWLAGRKLLTGHRGTMKVEVPA